MKRAMVQRDAPDRQLCGWDRLKLWCMWVLLVMSYACFAMANGVADQTALVQEIGLVAIVAYGGKRVLAVLVARCRR